jgi:hypothetical protein
MRESLRQWILWQAFLTIFFVVILGVLRSYGKRAFFSYWMKGWAVFGMWLGACWLSLEAGLPPVWKWSLIFVSLSLSYLEVCLLSLGAFSLYPGRSISARIRRGWTAGLLGFAMAVFGVAFALHDYPAASFALRAVPRSAALAAVYLYSALALHRSEEFAGSRGARLTQWGCFAYGLTSLIEAIETFAVGALGTVSTAFQALFELDAACELLVVAGMVLLLFEESRQFHQRLELYESIVPTCSSCGAVRDDAGHPPGQGEWMPLHDFVERYSAARFSHGYCPRCLEVQLACAREAQARKAA